MDSEVYKRTPVPEEEKIDFSAMIDDLWKAFRRFWWLILLVISVMASAFFFVSRWRYKPVYTAYSTFTVKTAEALGYSSTTYNQTVATQLGEVFPYILTSDVMQKLVAEDIGMEQVPGKIKATALESTNLITLSVEADNGQLAFDILQSVIRNYPKVSNYVIGNIVLNPMDESGVPTTPSNRINFRRNARNGAALGLLLCIIGMILYVNTRMTIRTEEDLRKAFNIPYLGSIPFAKLKKRSRKTKGGLTIDAKGAPYIFIESVRTVRNRIEREAAQNNVKTILVTSALPMEGKTTVAANLAISLARKERRVILVDADLRSPNVAETLGMEKAEHGFAELLTGEAMLKDVIVPYKDLKMLYVIQGSQADRDPSDLLNAGTLSSVISKLKKAADYVIIDTPSSAVVSDAAAVARYADGGVYVVRQDSTKVDILQEGMELFPGSGVKMLGCVLNATEAGLTGSGYGYGNYGYGRYGGYGKKYGYGYAYGPSSSKSGSSKTEE